MSSSAVAIQVDAEGIERKKFFTPFIFSDGGD